MHACFLVSIGVAVTFPAICAAQMPELRLDLRCAGSEQLLVSIRNTGKADTAVVVGSVLGNGAKYMIDDMRLSARGSGASEQRFRYSPRHYPSVVGGRVDDWIVPLPVSASYGLIVQPSEFISHTAPKRMDSLPSEVHLSVRLTVRAPAASNTDMEGIRLWRVWKEKDALVSNELRIPDDCR